MESQRRRPVWLAAALSLLSGGLYFVWWFGATWAELKRELGDATMRPVWHALASMVPVYATFRTYAHFRSIDTAMARAGLASRSGAGTAAALDAAAWLTGVSSLFLTGMSQFVAYAATAALYGLLTYRGQSALDAYWMALPGRQIPKRTHGFEWLALALSALSFIPMMTAPFAVSVP